MKRLLFIVLLSLSAVANAQTISTFAGPAGIYDPNGLAFDSYGNLYVTTALGCTIVKIDTTGAIVTIAGTGSTGFGGDNGPATLAVLNQPVGIAVDTFGNIIFSDAGNNRIRKINATTGIISTIVGTGTPGFYGDGGPASTSKLNSPVDICLDHLGNLYIADDGNMRVRKVNTLGIISTVAGNGTLGYAGDGGLATVAQCYPSGITTDNLGNLYVSNFSVIGSSCKIRKINASGIISTIAGDSVLCTYNGDGIPAISAYLGVTYITIHDGLLYLTDGCNFRVRFIDASGIIHTVAGNGTNAFSGDGGPATDAAISSPTGIKFDKCGNLYIGQVNHPRIRKVTFNPPHCTNLEVKESTKIELSIYPNPISSTLQIDNLKTTTQYQLYNMLGSSLMQGILKTGNNTLPIDGIEPGIYMLALIDEEGEKTVHKILKQ